jgi:hypothetical protein
MEQCNRQKERRCLKFVRAGKKESITKYAWQTLFQDDDRWLLPGNKALSLSAERITPRFR